MKEVEKIRRLLASCSPDQRHEIFQYLRAEFSIHALEDKLKASAEIILEAIHRASDLSIRGIRGLIAEAVFASEVVAHLPGGWKSERVPDNAAYDFLIRDRIGPVRIQVKLQRQKEHRPLVTKVASRKSVIPAGVYLVEVQKTRGGKDPTTGEDSRPYRFGEFDILAVCMQPSMGHWNSFRYSVANELVPNRDTPHILQKMQPIPIITEGHWTDDLMDCIARMRKPRR